MSTYWYVVAWVFLAGVVWMMIPRNNDDPPTPKGNLDPNEPPETYISRT